jgi:hypothetical protein
MPTNQPTHYHKNTVPPQRIKADFIRDWTKEKNLRGLNIAQAQAIIAEFFCGTIITRGVCPQDCPACRAEVIDLFRLEGAKKPGALLTWLAKDHAARWIEKLIERQKAEEFPSLESPTAPLSEREAFDALFPKRREEGNLFVDLAKEYE